MSSTNTHTQNVDGQAGQLPSGDPVAGRAHAQHQQLLFPPPPVIAIIRNANATAHFLAFPQRSGAENVGIRCAGQVLGQLVQLAENAGRPVAEHHHGVGRLEEVGEHGADAEEEADQPAGKRISIKCCLN
jgi:hypothetical protein